MIAKSPFFRLKSWAAVGFGVSTPPMRQVRFAKEMCMFPHSSSPSATSAFRKPVCERTWNSAAQEAPKGVRQLHSFPGVRRPAPASSVSVARRLALGTRCGT